jgi:hypothetical protein
MPHENADHFQTLVASLQVLNFRRRQNGFFGYDLVQPGVIDMFRPHSLHRASWIRKSLNKTSADF